MCDDSGVFGNNYVIVKGKFDFQVLVSDFLGMIDVSQLSSDYGISEVSVFGDEVLGDSDFVYSGSVLKIGDEYNYSIILLGDFTGDGYVFDDDVLYMEQLLSSNSKFVNLPLVDVNGDGVFNSLDYTYFSYSVKNKSWNSSFVSDVLNGSLLSNENILVGSEFEVNYLVSGFSVDFFQVLEGMLNYNSEYFEYIGCVVDEGYECLDVRGEDGNSASFLVFNRSPFVTWSDTFHLTFRFRAVKSGEASFFISDSLVSTGGKAFNFESNSSFVLVSAVAPVDKDDSWDDNSNLGSVNDNNVLVGTNNNVSFVNSSKVSNSKFSYNNYVDNEVRAFVISLSNDSYIESLVVKGYDIGFDRNVFEYDVLVGYGVKTLDLNVILSDVDASYEVIGNSDFKVGNNVVSIVVTALDGSTSTYTINVNRAEEDVLEDNSSNSARIVIIILIILVIIGLIYVIFKDDEDDES